MGENKFKEVGVVTHYFSKIEVAVAELSGSLSVGDSILVRGMTTDFEQVVNSMQIEHAEIQEAKAGQSIGLKVDKRVREGDTIYKITQ